MGAGGVLPYQAQGNSEGITLNLLNFSTQRSQSLGAKVQGREGNSPDRKLRSLNIRLREKGECRIGTAKRWAWKQPSLRESVIAQWSN